MAVCVAKKTLMRVIDEDNAMHGVVMVMVSEHGAGMSCGVAKLWLNCHYFLHYTCYFAIAAGHVPPTT